MKFYIETIRSGSHHETGT